jgi:O-antigen/teichoic acid export membrane protein
VQILANRGAQAVRAHLAECIEFLLVIVLPACLGFAVVAHHIAYVILEIPQHGEHRHADRLDRGHLSDHCLSIFSDQFSVVRAQHVLFAAHRVGADFNAIVCWFLITRLGTVGAAWARLAAEVFGFIGAGLLTLRAFPVPLPLRRLARALAAAIAMAVLVRGLDATLALSDRDALMVLLPAGIASYAAMCWLLDFAGTRRRLSRGILIFRNTFVH